MKFRPLEMGAEVMTDFLQILETGCILGVLAAILIMGYLWLVN